MEEPSQESEVSESSSVEVPNYTAAATLELIVMLKRRSAAIAIGDMDKELTHFHPSTAHIFVPLTELMQQFIPQIRIPITTLQFSKLMDENFRDFWPVHAGGINPERYYGFAHMKCPFCHWDKDELELFIYDDFITLTDSCYSFRDSHCFCLDIQREQLDANLVAYILARFALCGKNSETICKDT